jgi:hypothetical protein
MGACANKKATRMQACVLPHTRQQHAYMQACVYARTRKQHPQRAERQPTAKTETFLCARFPRPTQSRAPVSHLTVTPAERCSMHWQHLTTRTPALPPTPGCHDIRAHIKCSGIRVQGFGFRVSGFGLLADEIGSCLHQTLSLLQLLIQRHQAAFSLRA